MSHTCQPSRPSARLTVAVRVVPVSSSSGVFGSPRKKSSLSAGKLALRVVNAGGKYRS
jgi:hypothetical protein